MECDDEDMSAATDNTQQHPIVQEARSVFKQLKILCSTLRNGHDDDSGLCSLKVQLTFAGSRV